LRLFFLSHNTKIVSINIIEFDEKPVYPAFCCALIRR